MCSDTRGAMPVYRCTWAASASFSNGSRATPGWPKTLKRVPELPNAQEGSSIVCWASASRAREGMSSVTGSPMVGTGKSSWRDLDEVDAEKVGGGAQLGPE